MWQQKIKTKKTEKHLLKKTLIIVLIFGIGFYSCQQNETTGIQIGTTLFANQNKSKNEELKILIRNAFNGNETALSKLNKFPCGGGAGCYDLGFVISQIIYKVGEGEIIAMIGKLEKEEIRGLDGLIAVGLEYGDNDKDGKMDNRKIQIEFPRLLNALNQKENE